MKKSIAFLCMLVSTQVAANECVIDYNEILHKSRSAQSIFNEAHDYFKDKRYDKAAKEASVAADLFWETGVEFDGRLGHVYCFDETSLTERRVKSDLRKAKFNEKAAKCLLKMSVAERHVSNFAMNYSSHSQSEREEKANTGRHYFSVAKKYCDNDAQIENINSRLAVVEKLRDGSIANHKPPAANKYVVSERIDYSLFKIEKLFVKDSPQSGNQFETINDDCHIRFTSRSEGRNDIVEIDLSNNDKSLSFGAVINSNKELQLSLSPFKVNLDNYNVYIKYDNGEVLKLGGGKGRFWGLPVNKPGMLKNALENLSNACMELKR